MEYSNLITVLVRSYNQKSIIDKPIMSLLEQTRRPQIIVFDDASDDGSYTYIKDKFFKNDVQVYCHSENRGPAKVIKSFLTLCKTPYYMLIDGDDYWDNIHAIEEIEAMVVNNRYPDLIEFKNQTKVSGNPGNPDYYRHWMSLFKTDIAKKCPFFRLYMWEDQYYSYYCNLCKTSVRDNSLDFIVHLQDNSEKQEGVYGRTEKYCRFVWDICIPVYRLEADNQKSFNKLYTKLSTEYTYGDLRKGNFVTAFIEVVEFLEKHPNFKNFKWKESKPKSLPIGPVY